LSETKEKQQEVGEMKKKQFKLQEYQIPASDLLERLVDGKIVERGAMYDRMVINQQLGALLSIPLTQSPKRNK
jgi:hypothetical protein